MWIDQDGYWGREEGMYLWTRWDVGGGTLYVNSGIREGDWEREGGEGRGVMLVDVGKGVHRWTVARSDWSLPRDTPCSRRVDKGVEKGVETLSRFHGSVMGSRSRLLSSFVRHSWYTGHASPCHLSPHPPFVCSTSTIARSNLQSWRGLKTMTNSLRYEDNRRKEGMEGVI